LEKTECGPRGLKILKSKTWDEAILSDHRSSIKENSARDALDAMVAAAVEVPAYDTEPAWQGEVRIFKYVDPASGERPFAFIVNRKDLLFYIRAKGLVRVPGGFAALRRQFNSTVENKRGEWTVRIASKEDAESLNSMLFSAGNATENGGIPRFMAELKPGATGSVDEKSLLTFRHWWVNHRQAFRQEWDGSYLWSPKKNKNSANNESCNNMTRVLPGDIVYSFADAAIRAVGVVVGRAYEARRPADLSADGTQSDKDVGWQVPVRFRELETPVRPKDHAAELAATLPARHSPIRANGDGNQGVYLAAVPPAMAGVLRLLLGSQADTAERKIKESIGRDFSDDVEESRLQQRTDLGPVEKETLIRARRGHGRYRQDLERIEIGCRLTGLIDRRHLRASHLKPWCESNDQEKLDPNNGLLLSPHTEHLFDRGYISFTDEGELLVSRFLNPVVLSDWGLTTPIRPKPFNAKQCVYLDYHRKNVFERHGRGKEPDEVEAGDAENQTFELVLREMVPRPG
jgi:putative restriction endonuclease